MKLLSSVENKKALTGNGDHDIKLNNSKKNKYQVLFSIWSLWEEKGVGQYKGWGRGYQRCGNGNRKRYGNNKVQWGSGKTKIKHAYMEMS